MLSKFSLFFLINAIFYKISKKHVSKSIFYR